MRSRHDRDPDWAIRVILVAGVAGVVVAIRILFRTTWPRTLPAILALGLCAAWAAQLAAAWLFVLAGIERLRKAERSVVGTQWPGLVALLSAIGLAVAMLGLALIGGSENAIVL